ncbi:Clavaminate synthase-like protein [Ceratobasidium sp. AG-I]|nr:Clavaminate synthase-like protein [Ceratobasidium sp. AG-I]
MTITQTQSSPTAQKRAASLLEPSHPSEGSSKRPRNALDDSNLTGTISRSLHSNIKPSGNFLFNSTASIRARGLGVIHVLSDPLLLVIISTLGASDVLHLGSCSKALFAYCAHQPIWKDLFIQSSEGKLRGWAGTWRKTYLQQFEPTGCIATPEDHCMRPRLETPAIDCTGLFSDELYQPYLCANTDVSRYFYPRSRKDGVTTGPRSTMARADARTMTAETFERDFGSLSEPVVVFNALTHLAWPAFSPVTDDRGASSPLWSLQNLRKRFSQTSFRAEALDCSLQIYCEYADNCSQDDAPLYLFDSRFVEKTVGDGDSGMGADYIPPAFFGEDLFKLMEDKRPDYRWLIVGPERSGSTFHKDPNATSAWNAVITGSKGWVMFPPDTCPPGVYVSEDEAEVTSPLSLAEWFMSYFDAAWAEYGPNSHSDNRGKMKVGICNAGEIVYVPSGWWHLVVNLEASVAVTQNFASEHELVNVLRFMRDKPDQISGWSDDIACADLYETFCAVLRRERPGVLDDALKVLKRTAKRGAAEQQSVWDQVTKAGEAEGPQVGFSFGFEMDDEDPESEAE